MGCEWRGVGSKDVTCIFSWEHGFSNGCLGRDLHGNGVCCICFLRQFFMGNRASRKRSFSASYGF